MPHTELLLKAARKAYPQDEWHKDALPWKFIGEIKDRDHEIYLKGTYGVETRYYFSLSNGYDRSALQEALELDGWTFNAAKLNKDEYIFIASKPGFLLNATNKRDLLLSCIEGGS